MHNEPGLSSLEAIEGYITEGRNITKSTHYGVHYGTEEQYRMGVPLRYSMWKEDLTRFLYEKGFKDEAEFFSEGDSVPIIIGGLAHGDPLSPESLRLMSSIRRETSKKLEVLRRVRAAVQKENLETRLVKMEHFDLDRGILSINGSTVSISTTSGKENNPLRLLKTLMKDQTRAWFKDEIIEDWEGKDYEMIRKRIPRNRVYAAAKNLNSKIFERSGIRDFVLFDTAKFQINPKYLNKA